LTAKSALIDGEAVAFRSDGHSDFAAVRTLAGSARACLVALDLLNLNGEDFRQRPIEERRAALSPLVAGVDGVLFSDERPQQVGHLGVAVPFHQARHIIGLVTLSIVCEPYGRFETIPSRPISQALANTRAPSATRAPIARRRARPISTIGAGMKWAKAETLFVQLD
jgi:hypothetical protein